MNKQPIPATLIEIRREDGAQKYITDSDEVFWLSGWTRAGGVQVGDQGFLYWSTGPSYGVYLFKKEPKKDVD